MPRTAAIALILILNACAAVPVFASDPMVERPWPVDAPPAVSSSFCEYREGHLHAGIDVRTYGREGIPCIAAGDGYISRVRAAATGYGKVVYIQLDSGETLVYAHLSQFSAPIDSMVVAAQTRLGRYRVDFRPRPNLLRVQTGDIIAWSGSTGGVDPHLHFEVRNRQEHPMDPFAHGFALDDTLAPVIERVALVPITMNARIDGACFPLELPARRVAPGRYVIDDTVDVSGEVALQVEAVDLLNADSGRLAPRSLAVLVDGASVSRLEFSEFDFTQAGDVDFVYDVGRIRLDREYWYQLYPRSGRTLPGLSGPGWIAAAGGAEGAPRRVVVRVEDLAGNRSELSFTIVNGRTPGQVRARPALDYRGGEIPGLYLFEDFAAVAPGSGIEWPASPAGARDIHDRPLSLRAGDRIINLRSAFPGDARVLDFPRLGLRVAVGERTAYGDVVFYTTGWDGDTGNDQRLGIRSRPVQLGPYSLALRADLTLSFQVEAPDSIDAVYRRSERGGKWVFYPSEVEDGRVTTTAKRPGVYAVFADAAPPAILRPMVARRLIHALGRRIPEIQIRVEDTGSGVDYGRCAVFLDGVVQIARWDGRLKKLFVLIRDENIMGTQALTVVAYDNVGHRTQLDVHVDIPRQK
jgi:hypothetical protein